MDLLSQMIKQRKDVEYFARARCRKLRDVHWLRSCECLLHLRRGSAWGSFCAFAAAEDVRVLLFPPSSTNLSFNASGLASFIRHVMNGLMKLHGVVPDSLATLTGLSRLRAVSELRVVFGDPGVQDCDLLTSSSVLGNGETVSEPTSPKATLDRKIAFSSDCSRRTIVMCVHSSRQTLVRRMAVRFRWRHEIQVKRRLHSSRTHR
jgi:hypothetical protein